MPAAQTRQAALAAIAEHLETVGPHDWSLVRDRFPDVAEATFWRWVRQVKASAPKPEAIERAQQKLAELGDAATSEEVVAVFQDALPKCGPDPIEYLARNGEGAVRGINFIRELHRQLQSCEQLRKHATGPDGKIRNVQVFGQAVKLKDGTLRTAFKVLEGAYNMGRMERLRTAMLEAIREADPETARKVVRKLQEVDTRTGMVMEHYHF